MLIVHSLAYARKIPVKQIKLKIYGDAVKHLWNTFNKLANNHAKIAIIFGLYMLYSNKEIDRNRRNNAEKISINVFGSVYQLPIDTKKFSALSGSKMRFQ